MKNRGFTLIELIIVIAIIGSLGTVVAVSLTKTLNDTKEKECDNYEEELTKAIKVYANLSTYKDECLTTNGCVITLDNLVYEGLIEEDKKDPCKPPKSGNYKYKLGNDGKEVIDEIYEEE